MASATLPDPEVNEFLAKHYRGVQFDLANPHPEFKDATRNAKVIWAPTFLIEDNRGRELRRFTGWLPPQEWIAELRIPIALDHLHHQRLDKSAAMFARVVGDTPDSPAAPEALHWLGIVEFLEGKRDVGKLRARWNEVREQYPESRFARHSSVIDDVSA